MTAGHCLYRFASGVTGRRLILDGFSLLPRLEILSLCRTSRGSPPGPAGFFVRQRQKAGGADGVAHMAQMVQGSPAGTGPPGRTR